MLVSQKIKINNKLCVYLESNLVRTGSSGRACPNGFIRADKDLCLLNASESENKNK